MSQNESLLKSELGLSDAKLEKIYEAYQSGKMQPDEKLEFESSFPEYVSKMKQFGSEMSLIQDEAGLMSASEKPKVESYLNYHDPVKLAKIESAYSSGIMDPESKSQYEIARKDFLGSHGSGADSKVRLAVGAETDPARRLAVIKHYHPEAVQFGSDNFIINKDGKNQLFNPEGFDSRDISGAAPEIIGGAAGAAVALGSGGTATAIGGSALADAGGKRATQEAIRFLMGNNDIEGINPEGLDEKAKDFAVDSALGVAGGLLGAGVSKGLGATANAVNNKILRPMNADKARIIVNELDNASPEVKEALKSNGLLLSTAYPSAAKVEGAIAKMPIVGGGIQEAQRSGGLLLTDSIENTALKNAGMNGSDLTGTNIATRSANIADDIKSVRNENYSETLQNILDNNSKDRVPLNNFYDSINTYVSKFEDVGMDSRKIKELKTLMGGFDFDANPTPTYESIEAITKSLRQKVNDSNLAGDKKAVAKELLKSLEKDIMDIVPDDRLLRKDYAEKSGALDILGMRGGRAGSNLEQNLSVPEELITSPSTFNTKYNQLLKGRGGVFNPERTAEALQGTKELSDVLARAGLYENGSNTASSAMIGNTLTGLIGNNIGGGLLGAGAYGYYGGNNRTTGEVIADTGKGLLGGILLNKATNGLLKNQAEKAIRRSAKPSTTLEKFVKSSSGGLLNRGSVALGTLSAEEISDLLQKTGGSK